MEKVFILICSTDAEDYERRCTTILGVYSYREAAEVALKAEKINLLEENPEWRKFSVAIDVPGAFEAYDQFGCEAVTLCIEEHPVK